MMQQNTDDMKIFDRIKKEFTGIPANYKGISLVDSILNDIRYFFVSPTLLLCMNRATNNFELINIYSDERKLFPSGYPLLPEVGWQTKLAKINDTTWAYNSKTNGFYLLYIDTLNKTVRSPQQKFLPGYLCTTIFTDKLGKLWVGTPKGLFMEKKHPEIIKSFTIHLPDQPSGFAITSLYISSDKIFAGTNKEDILVLDKNTNTLIGRTRLKKLYWNAAIPLNFLLVHPDTLWAVTYSGLMWFHTTNYTSGNVFSADETNIEGSPLLFMDSKKNIWMGTSMVNRVYKYNAINKSLFVIEARDNPLFKVNVANTIAEDTEGNIWLGGDAIARWNSKTSRVDSLVQHLPSQRSWKKGYSLMGDSRQNVWTFVNDDGIARITGSGLPEHVRPPNFVHDKSVFVFPTLINDKVYIPTTSGIGLYSLADKKAVLFSESDGMPVDINISTVNFSLDKMDNSVWFAKQNTICVLQDRLNNIYMNSPTLSISELAVIKGDVLNYPKEKVSLKHFQNDIKISLSVLNFNDPGNMRFAYRFKNSDDSTWIDIGTQQNILLTNISPGTYNLQVKVNAYDNKWADSINEIEIVVKPPFWKTAWFLIGIALLIAGAVYYLYSYRIRQINQRANLDKLLAQTEMKALHTQMNPHFIFNCLNSIKQMILDNDNGKASRYLSKFAQLIRLTLNQSSKPFISLRTTIDYLHRYLEMEQVRNNRFTYSIETGEELNLEDTYIPPMLIQPFIENSIWHAELPENELLQISIRFFQKNNELICIVEDNGIGIQASLKNKEDNIKHHSFGIANIRQRIQVLNEKYNLKSTLNIEDKSDSLLYNSTGTLVTLHLPIKNTDA
jgi:hypothetical protein